MIEQISYTISLEPVGERLDKWLSTNKPELTRSGIQKLIIEGNIKVNGLIVPKNYKLKYADEIVVNLPNPHEIDIVAEDIHLEIAYEDMDLLVVNKAKGMVVHPAPGNYSGTMVNALMHYCKDSLSGINGVIRPGIVHRLDKNTSGLIIVAKNDFSHIKLAEQIKEHSFTREYHAICLGKIKNDSGTIDAPIGRDKKDRKKMRVTNENSRNAVTHYEVLEYLNSTTYTKFRLETGRTHQIRVHSAYIGHSVLGDDIYGKAIKGLDGQCLHARKIGFIHPRNNKYMEFESKLPDYFTHQLEKLKL